MSLLSTDITKVKRLSLKDVKLPDREEKTEAPPILVDPDPTDEEIIYSRLVDVNPQVEELVNRLNLVSCKTGEPIKKIELKEDIKAPSDTVIKSQEIDKDRLIKLAERIIEGQNTYTREEIVDKIKEATNVSQERAERGFNLILDAGAIEPTQGGRYYLTGSTPF